MQNKAISIQAWTGTVGSRRLRLPKFIENTGRWQGCQHYGPAASTPRRHPWYSALLEVESTPWPQCSWKDYVNKISQ